MPDSTDSAAMDDLTQQADARLKWIWQTTQIAGQPYELAVAADPDGMLIEACERQDAGEEGVIDPFWAATWRAAAGLDQFLSNVELADIDVLELGCGTGHAGIAAALRGANVVLTDGVDDPLLLVRMSIQPVSERCKVQRLRFGQDSIDDRKFPIILGSDVTYLRTLWPELEICWQQHLAVGGQVLLSDPYRIIANEFRDWIADRPWNYTEHKMVLDDDAEHPIRVMQLTAA
jgi:predicted nicotinamide N-methyase